MANDTHIRLLPVHVANKIAAGEVVDRPSSVVKELVENAIDAGATRIDVAVTAGGRNLISVRDNGCGMTKADALMSLERQATSKIRDVDDIEKIATLGFRGEAIPSIASVSRFQMTTRRQEDLSAVKVVVNAGTLSGVFDAGAPAGTLVEVRDLFCNVPARRKFLRSYATEEAHVRKIFTILAVSHPQIAFSLAVDGREVYRFPGGASPRERMREVMGADFVSGMADIDYTYCGINVSGGIERPNPARLGVRRDQYIFVNMRPATAPVISAAILDAYPRQAGDMRPGAVIFIDLPPQLVDVNVHPAKKEVRFRRPGDLKTALGDAIRKALNIGNEVSGVIRQDEPENKTVSLPGPVNDSPLIGLERKEPLANPFVPVEMQLNFSAPPEKPRVDLTRSTSCASAPSGQCEKSSTEHSGNLTSVKAGRLWRWFSYIGMTSSGYLIIETSAGIVIVNPKASRERVIYENLLKNDTPVSQPLLIPRTVHLPPHESTLLKGFLDEVRKAGFEIEEFGQDVWKVESEPQIAAGSDIEDVLRSIVTEVAEASGSRKKSPEKWRRRLIAEAVARSCANSRKFNLTPALAVKLVEELVECNQPYASPANKPTMIFLSNNELARRFDM